MTDADFSIYKMAMPKIAANAHEISEGKMFASVVTINLRLGNKTWACYGVKEINICPPVSQNIKAQQGVD